jgi:hypothetical protein
MNQKQESSDQPWNKMAKKLSATGQTNCHEHIKYNVYYIDGAKLKSQESASNNKQEI